MQDEAMFLVFFIGRSYNTGHFSTALERTKMKQKIVLATGNQGKVKEMTDVLADFGFDVIAQTDLGIDSPEETGLTFVENAILKARYAAEKSGLPAIADDSGLVVEALNGAPGLYSARYAGEEGNDAKNRAKLLAELAHVPAEQRKAKFVSTIVLLQHPADPSPIIAQGECHGVIAFEEKGENGFGYDALFFSPQQGCTFAELDTVEKKKISHRARALAVLKTKLSA
ncbi:non-canonical purine NTP pyrophosphatase, RdgB/HAM1 family [Aggregatibacter actinomycetemcomitans serotype e str. SC1083]|uniref:dITP/XTP pyrophosphatase n=2 Tax=Aggregatibacter actinomycetemcomitans TaxID=714 RepID=G4A8C6_AGGAC|nr:non-canonical purine NTP pyrophosphatase, RdgB/HAM1 family [Aggregatibacter actinomycetemcomitans serotype e str. SC1083]